MVNTNDFFELPASLREQLEKNMESAQVLEELNKRIQVLVAEGKEVTVENVLPWPKKYLAHEDE